MNSVENYGLRYLEPKDLDQYNALLRYTFQVTEDELIATGWKDEEIKQSKFPVLERADVLGCFDGDTLISQFAVYPLKMNIYGEVFQVGFVTSVCTYPEYTGQGIMKKLMIQSLTHMKQQEKSFALLYPYSIPLYHHLGWEIISNKISFNIKDRQIPTKVKAPGYVRRVAWDSSDFHELHSHFASITHGCLFRNALAWEEYWRWDEDDTNVAVYYNTKDKPCGFMVYLIKNDIMHIKEMIYLNREAKKGLWEYIHAHDSMIDEVHGNTYFSEPIAFEMDDGDIKESIRPGVVSDMDWFNNSYEREGQGSGTIIGESGSKLLILTERKVIKGASKIKVTFIDDTVAQAEVMKYDGNTGLVVLAVSKLDLETSTLASISVMEMGSANTVHKGSVVIALGSPLGTNYSILTGNITATNNEISTADSNYSVYTTDIVANRNGSGILINTDGQLVGLVMQDYSASSASTLTAVDISELKPVMELLFADKDIPYLGVQASTVTDKIASTYRIPKGIYIKEVDMDSPAMNAGLQSGDVIVKLAGKDVTTVASYSEIVLGLEPGENYKIVIKREGSNGYKIITCEIKAGILK